MEPVTARILAQLALKLATDDQARKRLFLLITIPLFSLLLIVAMVLQLLTSPFESLKLWLSPNEVPVVDNMRHDYGYTQLVRLEDEAYLESSGQSYEGVVLPSGGREVVYFNQLDSRWADLPYGPNDTIGIAGCGPTALSIVVSTLTASTVDPVNMANWAYEYGYLAEGTGSYHSLIPEGAKHYGLQVEGASTKDAQKINEALSAGSLIIVIMGKGHFTSSGHFIVLHGMTEEGQILVADPASRTRSEQTWDLSIILNEARQHAGAGGPFWIIKP